MSAPSIGAALRQRVHRRAGGRCEYCLIPQSISFAAHEIDHIFARKHGGRSDYGNLALSCALCNKYKGSDLSSLDPETGAIVPLFHPRRDRWDEHFQLEGPEFKGLTPIGCVTIRLLRLNHPPRLRERAILIAAGLLSPST